MSGGGRWRSAALVAVLAAGLLVPVSAVPVGAQTPPPSVDYDVDDDGLIEVSSLAQLNAIRFDLDGDGAADVYPQSQDGRTGHDPDGATKLAAAFPNAAADMGCPADGCDGYELAADLDFDTNGNGQADSGDEFWNGGKGWDPLIGGEEISDWLAEYRFSDILNGRAYGDRPHSRARMFTAVFEGNGRTIANLHIDRPNRWHVGLFGAVGPGGHVRNLGLSAPDAGSGVTGHGYVGALAGFVGGGFSTSGGRVSGVWSDVDVSGRGRVGGLIGANALHGFVVESYATGDVAGSSLVGGLVGLLNYSGVAASYATGDVAGVQSVGGLAGSRPDGHVRATYATGSVTYSGGDSNMKWAEWFGGLIGDLAHAYTTGWPRANYATGQVSVPDGVAAGGLLGACHFSEWSRAEGGNYWDTDATGLATSPDCGVGYTTAQLQAPTGYTGIYADWNVDVDVGDNYGSGAFLGPGDDPWDFGTSSQYPVLKYCGAKPGIDTADGQPYCPLQVAGQRSAMAVSKTLSTEEPAVEEDGPQPGGYVVDAAVVAKVQALAAQSHHGAAHVNRWSRVLVAFGVHDGTGVTGGAMTAAEAQDMADRHSSPVWDEVAAELTALEAASQQTPPPPPPLPVVSVTNASGGTEGDPVSFTVSASPAPAADLAVSVTVATSGDFGYGTLPASVTVPASGTVTVTVATVDDDADEPDGSVTLTLNAGSGYTVGAPSAETVTVTDDDDPAQELTAQGYTADPAVIAKVEALAAQTHHGTAHVNRWRRALAGLGALDPAAVSGGAMTAVQAQQMADTYSSPVWDEVAAELSALEAAPQQTPPPPPMPEVSITSSVGGVEGDAVSFTVSASPAPAADLAVSITVATAGDFGFGTLPASVVVPASGTATVTVVTAGDSTDEPDGSVTLTLVAGSGYGLGTPTAVTVTVADDDDPPPSPTPVVTISSKGDVTEGTAASFTLTASPVPAADLDVTVTVAAAGDFGVSVGQRTVTISASGTATLSVATTDDSADEADGSVTATVVDGAGYGLGTSKTATVTVSDDDPTPPPVQDQPAESDDVVLAGCGDSEPTLSISSPAASRSDATVEFEVALSCVPAGSPMVLVTPVRDGDIGENLFVSFSAERTAATVTVGIGTETQLGLALVWGSGIASRAAQGDVAWTD